MTDFAKGFISCAAGALVFSVFLAVAYFTRRRYPRTRELDVIDYDNAHPDGFVDHFKGDRR